MLTAKGLRLGQASEEMPEAPAPLREPPESPKDEGELALPVDQIDFSVRARKAMETLKVRTLGDLAALTEEELLACRNFGQTSLNEIRQRLAEHGLNLRESS